jgi:hypothetical protein
LFNPPLAVQKHSQKPLLLTMLLQILCQGRTIAKIWGNYEHFGR